VNHTDAPFCVVLTHGGSRSTIPISAAPGDTRLIWRKTVEVEGPDLLVEADSGGSAGCIEVIAVVRAKPSPFQRIQACHTDQVRLSPLGHALAFRVNFDVEGFNHASNAATATTSVPVVWRGGRFDLDTVAAAGERFTPLDLSFRRTASAIELESWSNEDGGDLGTPTTALALLDLIVNGHAATAHRVLLDAGRGVRGFKAELYWADLCWHAVQNPLWADLHMERLPEAGLVRDAARSGRDDRNGKDYLSGKP
jgi:hypothetical protein